MTAGLITVSADVCVGRQYVRGRRIRVKDVPTAARPWCDDGRNPCEQLENN